VTILDKFNLSGKTALVTGARRGIGKAMAVALAEAGADIVATSAAMEAEGSAVAREVAARGRGAGPTPATWRIARRSTRSSKR
jgi:2-deoxy-D-gluconate 3-dehydrogenase